MPELDEVKPVESVVAKRVRTGNKDRIKKDEQELKELLAEKEGNGVQEGTEDSKDASSGETDKKDDVSGEAVGKEEQSFKKRYGDLRKHLASKEKDWTSRIEKLEAQLTKATKNELILPKTEEEIDAWAKEYPDVAGIVETIASKKARESSAEIDKRLTEIETLRESAKKEKAEAELMALHPDFDKIRESDEFHDWAEEQPKWVQDALYENPDDARSAARVIDLYKVDKNITSTPSKKNSDKEAASAIRPSRSRSTPQADETASYLKESQVNRMSAQEYEKNSDSIMEAIRSGKFVYDISGAAR
tara:strand:+ start:971 stop:1882 length:912 start_codon:yes stop_codon:yes gene_type:complete